MFNGGLQVHNLCLNMSEVVSPVQGHKEIKFIPWTALMHKICSKWWKMVAAMNQVHPLGCKSIKTTLQVRLCLFDLPASPQEKMPRGATRQVYSGTSPELPPRL